MSATPVVSPIDAAVRRLYVLVQRRISAHRGSVDRRRERPADSGPASALRQALRTEPCQQCCLYRHRSGLRRQCQTSSTRSISTTKKSPVSSPSQGGIWGTAGAAVGSDGTIYFESGDGPYDAATGKLATTFQAYTFSNDQLTLKDYYTPSNYIWLSRRDLDMNDTPVVFPYKGRDLVVGSGKEGRFFLTRQQVLGRRRPYVAALSQRAPVE